MSIRQGTSLLLACTAAIACGGEAVVEPTPNSPPPVAPPAAVSAFASLGITPDTAAIAPGEAIPLLVRVLDQHGRQMNVLPSVAWSTSAPGIATVSSGGVVRGVSPGSASISATATVGLTTRTAIMPVRILPVQASTTVVLASGSEGWEPTLAYLQPGGSVEWRIGQTSWGGVPVAWIYLMNVNYAVVDSVDVRSGSATRTFNEPGVVRYCSGACWDAPDFGTIFVQ